MGIIGDGVEVMKLANIAANAELYGKLGKFVEEAQQLKARVEELEDTNRGLREQLRFKGVFLRIGGWVFQEGDQEPLCSRCSDVDNKPVHLLHQRISTGDIAVCPQCKTHHRGYRTKAKQEALVKQGKA